MNEPVRPRLRLGLAALGAAIAVAFLKIEAHVVEATLEEAKPNPTKPYKRRILKLDPIHQMARRLYKMKVKNPNFVRKRKIYRKLYTRKNKMLLERRHDFVKKARHRMGLDKKD